jgi:hypothetical protein
VFSSGRVICFISRTHGTQGAIAKHPIAGFAITLHHTAARRQNMPAQIMVLNCYLQDFVQ